jgi:hypothetical protein
MLGMWVDSCLDGAMHAIYERVKDLNRSITSEHRIRHLHLERPISSETCDSIVSSILWYGIEGPNQRSADFGRLANPQGSRTKRDGGELSTHGQPNVIRDDHRLAVDH